MTTFRLSEFLPYQLAVLSSKISREFAELYMERFDLTMPEWRVVAHLSQTPDAVSVREIFARVDMDKSKVSRAASSLEKRGLVIKRTNPVDRRLVELRLSDSGREMVNELAPLARRFEERVLARLDGREAEFRAAVESLLRDGDA